MFEENKMNLPANMEALSLHTGSGLRRSKSGEDSGAETLGPSAGKECEGAAVARKRDKQDEKTGNPTWLVAVLLGLKLREENKPWERQPEGAVPDSEDREMRGGHVRCCVVVGRGVGPRDGVPRSTGRRGVWEASVGLSLGLFLKK